MSRPERTAAGPTRAGAAAGTLVMPACHGYPGLADLVRRSHPDAGLRIEVHPGAPGSPAAWADRIRGADSVLHFFDSGAVDTEALVAERPRRVVIAGPAAGVVDTAAMRAAGVEVYDTPGLAADTVAEFTLTVMLALAHRLPSAVGAPGDWRSVAGRDLAGRTLGIVGWGRIGARLARLAQAIGMDVAAWSPSLGEEAARAVGVRRRELDTLLAESEVVSLHLRAVPETRGILDARRLALLRPDALLVNTARAALLDMAELRRRLRADLLGGAALDVLDVEPLPARDPLAAHPRVLVTPHMAWMTDDAVGRFLAAAAAFGMDNDNRSVRRVT
ncbi:phosphoglycerate dehydrogenase [Streptomyces sp. NBC_00669]|uniref:NAD(P)-dependent oxidoreductase n=1 Tax=Streptomyces sp. NBC_00669 TaxID=2976011 RepID=UPI002E3339F9|nr:NAD(P)-dependent oxidoreductase [Streptomyces sp. NBC_00669]